MSNTVVWNVASKTKSQLIRYMVCLESPPFPRRGYYIKARRYPKNPDVNFRDSLSPDLVNHVIVDAENIEQAKAIALKKFVNGD